MAKATWTTKPPEVVLRQEPDGGFYAEVPLYDNNVKQLTLRLAITADRAATLSGFQAWSDL
jgi:hypothetical protein